MTHSGRREASRAAGVCSSECLRRDAFIILDTKYSWWSDVRGLALASLSYRF